MTRRKYAPIPEIVRPLVVRTPPVQGEGFLGWVLRLTQINSYEFTEWILRSAGMRAPDLLPRPAVIERLQSMTRVPAHELQIIVPRMDVSGWRWAEIPGMDISVALIDARRPKVCPRCLAEKGFIQAAWGLRVWTCCPEHGCRLVNACPNCASPISWRRRHIDRCPEPACSGRYSASETRVGSPEEVDLALLLGEAFRPETIPRPSDLGRVFGDMAPQEIITMASRLGFRRMREGYRNGSALTDDAEAPARKAARILADWPRGFHDFIRSQRTDAKDPNAGRAAEYAEIAFLLRQDYNGEFNLPARARIVFAEEFLNFLEASGDGSAPVMRQVLMAGSSPDRWISRPQAARALGVDMRTLTRMAHEGSLAGTRVVRNDKTFMFVDRREIARRVKANASCKTLEHLRAEGEALSHGKVGRLLGVRIDKVRSLLDEGLLTAIDGTSGRFVSRASVLHLLGKVESLLPDDGRRADVRPVYDTCQVVQRVRGLGMGPFVRAVLDGNIRPASILGNGTGLRRFGYLRTDVARFSKDVRLAAGSVHVYDAARQLTCPRLDIPRLVAVGLLRQGKTGIEVDAGSIREFQEEHASGPALAKQFGTMTNLIERRLGEAGIEPVLRSLNPGRSATFWRRSDVARLPPLRGPRRTIRGARPSSP